MERKRNKGIMICFTGIDGAGKSTLARQLTQFLNIKGFEYTYVYARLKPFILKPFIFLGEKIFLKNKNIFDDYIDYSNTKKKAFRKHELLSKIYYRILILDYLFQIYFKVKLPLMLGKNIICDRYIYDSVITDISVDMNVSHDKVISLLNKLLYYFPKPEITFIIDIPEEIAYQRKKDIPSIDYLRDRRKMYLDVAKTFGFIVLDGSEKLENTNNKIQKHLKYII